MSRKFIGGKELNFVNSINRELIQNVIGQEVIYYQVLAEKTHANDLYNEAIDKVYAVPVKCNCLVYYENTTETVSNFPADSKFKVDVFFHTAELLDRNLSPKMGDFVQFGEVVYEIYTITKPQMAFGQIEQKVMTKCSAGPARRGQFNIPIRPPQRPGENLQAPKYSEQPRDVKLKGDR
jgi:hypothetical protein